ncbi:hypothetical protein [Jannaschia ovalis]|uniref:YMGG-like Gly-zipper n=1 Tax=Jannaschia ovalis TaxID=3038773 RepID=A0ABY8L9L5_9RHOB|nr:hypothetical protein [Jannaschia sp. GRR-S6-38]WGH78042.1 hypothetical protein P8627_13525 [Jannaschia sp. GRR-S6-38]
MVKIPLRAAGIVAALALSGCYGTDVERAGAGALIGGLGAAALDKNVAGGALIGAAGGALADDLADFTR